MDVFGSYEEEASQESAARSFNELIAIKLIT